MLETIQIVNKWAAAGFDTIGDQVRTSSFENGIQLATQGRYRDDKLRFAVRIGVGAYQDPSNKPGITHFLEHVLFVSNTFKGFEERGGRINAYTSPHELVIVGFLDKNASAQEFFIESIAKMLTNSPDADIVEKERRRILNEIGIAKDTAAAVHGVMAASSVVGEFQGILGSQDSVEKMTVADLVAFKKEWFYGENIQIAVTGPWDHKALCDDLSEALNAVPARTQTVPNEFEFCPRDLRVSADHVNQAYFGFSFPVCAQSIRERKVLEVAEEYLNNRVVNVLLRDSGLCYGAWVFASTDANGQGALTINGNILPNNLEEVAPKVAEILRTAAQCLDEDVFNKARKRISDQESHGQNLLMMAHFPEEIVSDLANFGRVPSIYENKKEIESVTAEEVRAAIDSIVFNNPVSITVLGDHSRLQSYEDFLGMLYGDRGEIPAFNPERDIS